MYVNYETTIRNASTFVASGSSGKFSTGREVIIPASGETEIDISRASCVDVKGVLLGGDLNVLVPNKDVNPTFLALEISNGKTKKALSSKAQGKTVVHIHENDIVSLTIDLPKLSEQMKVSRFFDSLDSSIVLHQRESFSSTQAGKRPHDEVDVLVLELLDDVEIDLLGGGHAGVPKTPGDAGDRHPGVEQERGVGVPEAVHGDDRDAQIPAVAGQNAVHRRVVDLPVHEDWLIVGQILQGLGELGDDLPVDLDLPHGGLVLRRHEAVLALVVVGFVDREGLVGEVEVLGGHRQRLGEAHSGLGNQ